MAITAEGLVQPDGPIDPLFFPDDDEPPAVAEGSLLDRLSTYISRAETIVAGYPTLDAATQDRAVENWSLHLAFKDAHSLMAARPASETLLADLGSTSFNSSQLKVFEKRAEEYLRAFYETVSFVRSQRARHNFTRATENTYDW